MAALDFTQWRLYFKKIFTKSSRGELYNLSRRNHAVITVL
jgi:hypothetical protein